MQAAAALGPAGVWAFGVIDPRLNLMVPYSARYHGRAGRVRLPVGLLTVSALGREDVGHRPHSEHRGQGPGRSWRHIADERGGLTVFARGETLAAGRPVT